MQIAIFFRILVALLAPMIIGVGCAEEDSFEQQSHRVKSRYEKPKKIQINIKGIEKPKSTSAKETKVVKNTVTSGASPYSSYQNRTQRNYPGYSGQRNGMGMGNRPGGNFGHGQGMHGMNQGFSQRGYGQQGRGYGQQSSPWSRQGAGFNQGPHSSNPWGQGAGGRRGLSQPGSNWGHHTATAPSAGNSHYSSNGSTHYEYGHDGANHSVGAVPEAGVGYADAGVGAGYPGVGAPGVGAGYPGVGAPGAGFGGPGAPYGGFPGYDVAPYPGFDVPPPFPGGFPIYDAPILLDDDHHPFKRGHHRKKKHHGKKKHHDDDDK